MILSGFSSDEPNRPGISPGVVAVLCGVLFFFFPFMVAFLWWRTVHPYLQAFTGWVSETGQKAKKWFSRKRRQTVVLPPPDSPHATEPILYPPPSIGRHHGPDSVDTLPRYTPSDTLPPTEYSRSTSETG